MEANSAEVDGGYVNVNVNANVNVNVNVNDNDNEAERAGSPDDGVVSGQVPREASGETSREASSNEVEAAHADSQGESCGEKRSTEGDDEGEMVCDSRTDEDAIEIIEERNVNMRVRVVTDDVSSGERPGSRNQLPDCEPSRSSDVRPRVQPAHSQWRHNLSLPSGVETRIDKIPKEVLGRYGIVVEDDDDWRDLPQPAPDAEVEEIDDEDEDGRLVIDVNLGHENEAAAVENGASDGTVPVHSTGQDNVGHSALENFFMASVKSLKENLKCNICQEVAPNLQSLEEHKRQHCTFHGCLDLIEDESERNKHLQVHEAHPLKPFRCEFCKKRFHYYRFSKKHSENCKHVKRSKCPYCRSSFTKVSLYNKHIARHLTKITCIDCNKTYIQPKKYNRHLYMHHRKQVIYQCPECPRRFQVQENMMRHIKVHDLHVSKAGLLPFIQVQDIN